MQGAEHIVAVNRDEHAPIVSFSDASFVGRLEDVLPALVRQLRAIRDGDQTMGTPVSDFDAIVVGAGPAGTTAALAMVRAGARVLLLERGEWPGAKNMFGGMLVACETPEGLCPASGTTRPGNATSPGAS